MSPTIPKDIDTSKNFSIVCINVIVHSKCINKVIFMDMF